MTGRPLTPEQVTKLQQALSDHGFQPGPIDGIAGAQTSLAIINARIAYKLSHQDQALYDVDLERSLGLLAIQSPEVKSSFSLLFPLILSIITKGALPMNITNDQINGIVRLVLGLIGGYFVSKGIVSQSAIDWVTAGALTLVPAIWSWYSNRPKTIMSIADKKALNG